MFKTKALAGACGLLFLLGTAAGCNKNKIQDDTFLDLNTRILIHESNLGSGKNLEVSVVDKRRRDSIIKKDSERKIRSGRALALKDYHPSHRLDIHFEQTATEAFQMQGYETNGEGIGTPRKVTIYITKLDLRLHRERTPSATLPKIQARVRTKVKLTAKKRGRVYGNDYEFFIKKSYPGLPEKLETEKILNYGLTQLLHQILEDPKLAQFLTS